MQNSDRRQFVEGYLNDLYLSGRSPNLEPPRAALPNAGNRVMRVETCFAGARRPARAMPDTPLGPQLRDPEDCLSAFTVLKSALGAPSVTETPSADVPVRGEER